MTDSNEIDLSKLTRIGQGRTAEVFALDEARVIKVARDGAAAASLDREATAMRRPIPRTCPSRRLTSSSTWADGER
jgi:hypothetical protein